MRCLLIDDDEAMEPFVSEAMPPGSTLAFGRTLEDALDLLVQDTYDLIMVDLSLPGCRNGEALYKTLELCPQTAVLVFTQSHSVFHAENLIARGATWVYFKPDAAIDEALAVRLLGETMVFTVDNHAAHQEQLLSLSQNAQAIHELQRELRRERDQLAVHWGRLQALEVYRQEQADDLEALRGKLEAREALDTQRAVEREKGKWGMWAKIIGLVGTALAAILGHWASSRWGKP